MTRVRPWLLLAALGCHDPGQGTSTRPPTVPPTPTTATTPLEDDGGPSGASFEGDALVFRVPSRDATRVEAWLYDEPDGDALVAVVLERRGDRFHGSVPRADLPAGDLWYGLRAWGPNWPYDPAWAPGTEIGFVSDVDGLGNRFNPNKLLIDPWARELSHDPVGDWWPYATGDHRAQDSAPVVPKGLVLAPEGSASPGPGTLLRDTVVYEVHVRGLTMNDPDVPEALRGTYAGAALKAPYLADLGVTAIELLPLHETTNDQNDLDPTSAAGDNYWGYSSLSYFAPDRRYASDRSPGGPTRELKAMVEAFHAEGIEVWVDVVYNHTAEGGTWGEPDTAPLLSWRGLDNAAFYQLDGPTGYRGDSGVGPNVNVADPLTRDLVLDSLRYWTDELGVDGYRFDLAAILGNACLASCFEFDAQDPDNVLNRAAREVDAHLVAEPWAITTWQGGRFPAGWAEWNDGFRDTVRADQNALGSVSVTPGQLANALSGSWDRFGDDGRKPWHSVNFVAAHDGFTHADLYACNDKDNDLGWPYGPSDGGSDYNLGWDQGGDPVAQRRAARTGMALLVLSAGVPMFNGGDEFLRSQRCNNNPYNLDSPGNWLDWAWTDEGADFHVFTRELLRFRAAHPALRPDEYRPPGAITWLEPDGTEADPAYLDNVDNHALAMRLDGPAAGDPALAIYVAVNGWTGGVTFQLPPAPSGGRWRIVADSHEWLEADRNVFEPGTEPELPDDTYLLGGRSVVVLIDP